MRPLSGEQLEWFTWMLVNGRNHWWFPDETAEGCVVEADGTPVYDDPVDQQEALTRERGMHWGKFLAHDELIYDFGRALLGHEWPPGSDEMSHGERRRKVIAEVERIANRYVARCRAEGQELPFERTRAELTEEWKERREDDDGDG